MRAHLGLVAVLGLVAPACHSSAASVTDAGVADAAPAPPDAPAPLDTSVLVADEGAAGCRLSAEREALLVRVRNDGAAAAPALDLELASDGTPYTLRATLEPLAPGRAPSLSSIAARWPASPIPGPTP